MTETLSNLVDLNDIDAICANINPTYAHFLVHGKLHCPYCNRTSRFELTSSAVLPIITTGVISRSPHPISPLGSRTPVVPAKSSTAKPYELIGSVAHLKCTTCEARGHIFFHIVGEKPRSLVFFRKNSSIAMKNTPDTVKYFLEQAAACKRVKAFSATYAMYRTALDALLFDCGYQDGMVGNKIAKIEKELETNSAPIWVKDLNIEYLRVIKNLGNSSLHISKADLTVEKNLTEADIALLEKSFSKLLYVVYEKSAEEEQDLAELKRLAIEKG